MIEKAGHSFSTFTAGTLSKTTVGQKIEINPSSTSYVISRADLTDNGAVQNFSVTEPINIVKVKSIDSKTKEKTWSDPTETSGNFYFCDKDDILLYSKTGMKNGDIVDFTTLSIDPLKIARVFFRASAKENAEACTVSGNGYLQGFSVAFDVFYWELDGDENITHENLPAVPDLWSEPLPLGIWQEGENLPFAEAQPEVPELWQEPIPKWLWRTAPDTDNGFPWHELLPWVKKITYTPVYQPEYITIYDLKATAEELLDTNGLAVLTPISCTITEILNGEYTLSIEHAIDPDGKWQYIIEKNIIKALGQLFVIVSVEDSRMGQNRTVRATAEHIFYVLNDYWILPKTCLIPDDYKNYEDENGEFSSRNIIEWTIGDLSEQNFGSICEQNFWAPDQRHYDFAYDGNVEIPESVALYRWGYLKDGYTVVDIILGSNGIIASSGGELYRDNFYFSVCPKMENMQKDSFNIYIGYNLTGITRTSDWSQFCNFFYGYAGGKLEYYLGVSNSGAAVLYPRNVVRSQNFSYDLDNTQNIPGWEEKSSYDRLHDLLYADVYAYYYAHCKPIISYRVSMEDVKNNPEYREFSNNPRYNVGDTGRVYDVRTGEYVNLRLSQTVKDAITGKTIEVTFGDVMGFSRSPGYDSGVIDFKPEDLDVLVRDSDGNGVFDKSGAPITQMKEGGIMATLNRNVDEINAILDKIGDFEPTEIEERLTALESQYTQLGEKVQALETQYTDLSEQVKDFTSKYSGLETKITQLESNYESLDGRVKALEGDSGE